MSFVVGVLLFVGIAALLDRRLPWPGGDGAKRDRSRR
jgi:hypothetical protein